MSNREINYVSVPLPRPTEPDETHVRRVSSLSLILHNNVLFALFFARPTRAGSLIVLIHLHHHHFYRAAAVLNNVIVIVARIARAVHSHRPLFFPICGGGYTDN